MDSALDDRKWETSNKQHDSEFESPTFGKEASFFVNEAIGSASISPSGRDVVLASREGLHIIDLDNPYSPPRHLSHRTPWEVADVQWSPFAARDYRVASTSNQKALIWNLERSTDFSAIEYVLHAHTRAITDINFSLHNAELLATCGVDSHVHCWDLRVTRRPGLSFCNWSAGATQVKYNRQDPHVLASAHDRYLCIWDDRKGTHPLRMIQAHNTKIYGIDWNHLKSNRIITCSLDRTIKSWDISSPDDDPKHIIRAPFPVWRARHTPFGRGILAMAQRDSYNLHLYDNREEPFEIADTLNKPVWTFEGHSNQVKEFLWRTRNSVGDLSDEREFQLVSWGTDRDLRLHRVDDRLLDLVGHNRNSETAKRYSQCQTRAIYKTFNNDQAAGTVTSRSRGTTGHGLSSIFGSAVMSGTRGLVAAGPKTEFSAGTYDRAGIHIKATNKQPSNPLQWMKGVRVGKSHEEDFTNDVPQREDEAISIAPWDTPESLSDEIVYIGEKFKGVHFESIDMTLPAITISLHGPWGADNKLVYLKMSLMFSDNYPNSATPDITIEKPSTIQESTFNILNATVRAIADHCSSRWRGCLEALISYLSGDRTLKETISWVEEEQKILTASDIGENVSSSEDEDGIALKATALIHEDLNTSANEQNDIADHNVNVPLPKACGALWADDGRLICFFPRKDDKSSILANFAIESAERSVRYASRFAGVVRGLGSKRRGSSTSGESNRSSRSTAHSSTDASSGDDDAGPFWHLYQNAIPRRRSWTRLPRFESTEYSRHSISAAERGKATNNNQTYVVLHDLEHLLPSKKDFALEYKIFGKGPDICSHNADIARRHGAQDLECLWKLCEMILQNNIPLERIYRSGAVDVLVLARQSLVQTKSHEKELDRDQGNSGILLCQNKAQVKWGHHPLAGTWLIPALFQYFEKRADVQMLAMLSCIFSERIAKLDVSITTTSSRSSLSPTLPQFPAFSNKYHPSEGDARLYMQQQALAFESVPSSPSRSDGYQGRWTPFIANLSADNECNHEYDKSAAEAQSVGVPVAVTGGNMSFKSPEKAQESRLRRGNASIGSSFAASFSTRFPFVSSTSPPPNAAFLGAARSTSFLENQESMAYSHRASSVVSDHSPPKAPSIGLAWHRFGASVDPQSLMRSTSQSQSEGVTVSETHWLQSRVRSHDEENRTSFRGQQFVSGQRSADEFNHSPPKVRSTPEEHPETFENKSAVSVSLRNQDMFDDEAYVSVPLLQHHESHKLHAFRSAYAHLLFIWGLNEQRCEILKFNSLSAHFDASVRPNIAHGSSGIDDINAARPKSAGWQGFSLVANLTQCLQCSICFEIVLGLHKACLRCGHISHVDCLSRWYEFGEDFELAEPSDVAEDHEYIQTENRECEAGCGCICTVAPAVAESDMMDEIFDRSADGLLSSPVFGDWEDEWGAVKGLGQAQSRIAI